jgi:hypothetical protein
MTGIQAQTHQGSDLPIFLNWAHLSENVTRKDYRMAWWFHWCLVILTILAMVHATRVLIYDLLIQKLNHQSQFLYLVISILLLSLGAYLTDHLEIFEKWPLHRF